MMKYSPVKLLRKQISEFPTEFPNSSWTHDLQEYWLDALTTELWRTHGKQGCKLGSYVWHMLCHICKAKNVEIGKHE